MEATYIPSTLDSRSIVVVRHRQMKILQLAKILKFGNLNLKVYLGCLNGFMVLMALYQ